MRIPNRDPETGIAYGIIDVNSVHPWVLEAFRDQGKNMWGGPGEEPAAYGLTTDHGEYMYDIHSRIIWALKSKDVVKARMCSPCAPGAGDLTELDGSMVTYNIPHDWRKSRMGTFEKYVELDAAACPRCGSPELEAHDLEVTGKSAIAANQCESCGMQWNEHFTLTAIRLIPQ